MDSRLQRIIIRFGIFSSMAKSFDDDASLMSESCDQIAAHCAQRTPVEIAGKSCGEGRGTQAASC